MTLHTDEELWQTLLAIAADAAQWAAPQQEICSSHRFLFAQIAARIRRALDAQPAEPPAVGAQSKG